MPEEQEAGGCPGVSGVEDGGSFSPPQEHVVIGGPGEVSQEGESELEQKEASSGVTQGRLSVASQELTGYTPASSLGMGFLCQLPMGQPRPFRGSLCTNGWWGAAAAGSPGDQVLASEGACV